MGWDRQWPQVRNDTLVGGIGIDTCFRGTGFGPVVRCERPAPPPPPEPPTLVIAYTDLNGNDTFDAGDVMVNRIIDTDGDAIPSKGDAILMGRYPTSTNPGPTGFADWGVRSHVVDEFSQADKTEGHLTFQSQVGIRNVMALPTGTGSYWQDL